MRRPSAPQLPVRGGSSPSLQNQASIADQRLGRAAVQPRQVTDVSLTAAGLKARRRAWSSASNIFSQTFAGADGPNPDPLNMLLRRMVGRLRAEQGRRRKTALVRGPRPRIGIAGPQGRHLSVSRASATRVPCDTTRKAATRARAFTCRDRCCSWRYGDDRARAGQEWTIAGQSPCLRSVPSGYARSPG
jgi:hypothetical protein